MTYSLKLKFHRKLVSISLIFSESSTHYGKKISLKNQLLNDSSQ